MPTFPVEKSLHINASPAKVYEIVRNFEKWPIWSPWLIAEPKCSLEYATDGKSYSWKGHIVGSGNMAITLDEPNQKITYDLNFLKPFKSSNTTEFVFEEKEGGTQVTWTMVGSLPFFMFFMKATMSAWIGMDYQRGLRMLKDYCESNTVHSKLEFRAKQKIDGVPFVGIRTKCRMEEIGEQMRADFTKLTDYFCEKEIVPTGHFFSLYHKTEMVKGTFDYTACIPVEEIPENIPEGFVIGHQLPGETYAVQHKGPYEHLGNAWAVGMMHGQGKRYKSDKKRLCFEVYENDPSEAEPSDLLTTVHFPSK